MTEMHAVVATWELDAARILRTAPILHQVTIPQVKETPGFIRGVWLRTSDLTRSINVLIYDSEEHALAAKARAEQPMHPEAPVRLLSAEVFEVLAEAAAVETA
jgi:hypothetical protein